MRGIVSIVKVSDARDRATLAVAQAGGLDGVVGRGDKVFVKPNLVEGHRWETGETVNPEFLAQVVKLSFAAGASEVLVGESPPGDIRIVEKEVKSEGGIPINLDEYPYDEVSVSNPVMFHKVRLARPVLTCDVFINVPTLKTHPQTGITVALKNYYGLIPSKDKGQYHRLQVVEEAIVDLNQAKPTDFVVVDGTSTILHSPPVFKEKLTETIQLELALAGRDAVAVDAVSANLLRVPVETLRFLRWASEKGLGVSDLARINTKGLSLNEARAERAMTSVDAVNKKHSHIKVIDRGACTGCYGRVIEEIYRLDERDMTENVYITMGPVPTKPPPDGSALLCGNCAAPTYYNGLEGTFVAGCPPDQEVILAHLKSKRAL